MIKNKYVAYVIFVVAFVVLWDAINLLFEKNFAFDATKNIVAPLGSALVIGYLIYLRKN